jgi:hypothetical protein
MLSFTCHIATTYERQVPETYPGGWPNHRAPSLFFPNPRLREDDVESGDVLTKADSSTSPTLHVQTASESSVEPPSPVFNPPSKAVPEAAAFARLTMPDEEPAEEVKAVDVDQILEDLYASRDKRAEYLALRGPEACTLLDALQLVSPIRAPCSMLSHPPQWLDNNLEHKSRRKIMRLLIDVAGHSNELPHSLFVTGIDIGASRDPHSYGSFADVFRGTYENQIIAVKRLRINERGEARNDAHRVRGSAFCYTFVSLIRCTIEILQGGPCLAPAPSPEHSEVHRRGRPNV